MAGRPTKYTDELANRIDSVIENMEVVYNHAGEGLLVNWEQVLASQCRKLREIQKEIKEFDKLYSIEKVIH